MTKDSEFKFHFIQRKDILEKIFTYHVLCKKEENITLPLTLKGYHGYFLSIQVHEANVTGIKLEHIAKSASFIA